MIKRFKAFREDIINESEFDYYRGNNPVSKWLRKLDSSMEYEYNKTKPSETETGGLADAEGVASLIPMAIKTIAGTGAAISDFLFKNAEFKGLPTKEIRERKKEILDKWEKEKLSNRAVTEKDAADFYKSGVLKGMNQFGKDYNPAKPKSQEERVYSGYLRDSMKRYYKNIYKKR